MHLSISLVQTKQPNMLKQLAHSTFSIKTDSLLLHLISLVRLRFRLTRWSSLVTALIFVEISNSIFTLAQFNDVFSLIWLTNGNWKGKLLPIHLFGRKVKKKRGGSKLCVFVRHSFSPPLLGAQMGKFTIIEVKMWHCFATILNTNWK